MDAIILAGTHKDKSKLIKRKNKAFLLIKGKPIIKYVYEALKQAKSINNIYIIGPKKELSKIIKDATIIQERQNKRENILENLKYVVSKIPKKKSRYLFITCDIPLIKGFMVDEFIKKTEDKKTDLFIPYVPKKIYESHKIASKMPIQFRYANFKEGKFRLGNMVIAKTSAINNPLVDKIYQHRKLAAGPVYTRIYNIFYIIRIAGFFNILNYALGHLSLQGIEKTIEKKFKVSTKSIILNYPEITIDIDYLDDYLTLKNFM